MAIVTLQQKPINRVRYSAGGGGSALIDGVAFPFTSTVSSTFPNFEFLGGNGGVIASGSLGTTFTRTNWIRLYTTLSDWKYSNARTLSRAQSLIYDGVAQEGQIDSCRGTYQFDVGSSGSVDVYRNRNVYWDIDPSYNGVQWKTDRWQTRTDHDGGSGPEVVDGYPPSVYVSSYPARDNFQLSNFTANSGYVGGVTNNPFNQAVYDSTQTGINLAFPQNGWYNYQLYMRDSSSLAAADGAHRVKMIAASTGSVWMQFATNNRTYRSASDVAFATNPFRYVILQNYFGNGPATPGGNSFGSTKLYMDDIYIAWSLDNTAQRRVELINASTPGAATKSPVIQPTTKSGTTLTPTINLGHIGTGQSGLYLVEYDESNTVITTAGPYTS